MHMQGTISVGGCLLTPPSRLNPQRAVELCDVCQNVNRVAVIIDQRYSCMRLKSCLSLTVGTAMHDVV